MTELTVRQKRSPFMTSLSTGEASSRMVDAYRLHPNAIKNLARCGQGYLLSDTGLRAVAYGMLPFLSAGYELPRNQQREAASVFADPLALAVEDAVDPGRALLIGLSDRRRVLLSVYTEIDDDTVRILSARRATSHERRHYEEGT